MARAQAAASPSEPSSIAFSAVLNTNVMSYFFLACRLYDIIRRHSASGTMHGCAMDFRNRFWRLLLSLRRFIPRERYRPERHYMRGPGPRTAKAQPKK
jgi:hypothetical protein